jgi:hypothetical protein
MELLLLFPIVYLYIISLLVGLIRFNKVMSYSGLFIARRVKNG